MANEDELRIALSPVQLAAVLSDESVTEGETLSNRLLGGLGLAGGVVELMGAGGCAMRRIRRLSPKLGVWWWERIAWTASRPLPIR